MTPIKVLAHLHNSRNEYKDKTGFADSFRHTLISSVKRALTETIKLTGITKALVGKRANRSRAEQIADDVYSENNLLGRASIHGCSMILGAIEDVFSPDRIIQMCDALTQWKNAIPGVIKYAEGTPNQAAADATFKMICDILDELINMERPSPVLEIAQAFDNLFLRLTRYVFLENQEERQEKARDLRASANEFINSANYVASAIPSDKRTDVLKVAERLNDDLQTVMEAVKNATSFSNPDNTTKAEETKEIFKNTCREIAEIYESVWGKSVRKPSVVKEIGSSQVQDRSMEQIIYE